MIWRRKKKSDFQEFMEKTLLCTDLLSHFNKLVNKGIDDKVSAMLKAKEFVRDTDGYITMRSYGGETTVLCRTQWFADCTVTGSEFRSYRKLKTPDVVESHDTKVLGITEYPSDRGIIVTSPIFWEYPQKPKSDDEPALKRGSDPIRKPEKRSKYSEYRTLKWLGFMYNYGDYCEVSAGKPFLSIYDGMNGHVGNFSIPFVPKYDHKFYINRVAVDINKSGIPYETEEVILDVVITALAVMKQQKTELVGRTMPFDRKTWWLRGASPMITLSQDLIVLSDGNSNFDTSLPVIRVGQFDNIKQPIRMTLDELQSIALEVLSCSVDDLSVLVNKSSNDPVHQSWMRGISGKMERVRKFYESAEKAMVNKRER